MNFFRPIRRHLIRRRAVLTNLGDSVATSKFASFLGALLLNGPVTDVKLMSTNVLPKLTLVKMTRLVSTPKVLINVFVTTVGVDKTVTPILTSVVMDCVLKVLFVRLWR